ncbi:MAG: hypothetical protein JSV80_12240 [Acidobacteriota bacterium]|nr:MAG: hypothetical protein JSV80_12240 [Acidobacteriota bacterium]
MAAGRMPRLALRGEAGQAEVISMAYTYEELSKKTVAQLRTIAEGLDHDAVRGFSTMHKEHLLPALCEALGIEAHMHHEVVGINKAEVKAQIRQLRKERDAALVDHDHARLKRIRRRIHRLKRKIHRATV